MTLLKQFSVFAALMLWLSVPVAAYDMKPIVVQLSPSGAGASQTVLITNTHQVPIAIEVRAYTRRQNADGTEERELENNDIIISPPQMVIAPGASQSFQVRWVGDPAPAKELSYRLVTQQLPIKFKNENQGGVSAKVDMSYSYEAALYIVPPKSAPVARLSGIAHVTDASGKSWLEMKISSEGSRRAILKDPVIDISPANGGATVTLEGDAMKSVANLNILVGNERVLRLPWPDGLPKGEIKGTLRTDYTIFN